METWRLHIQLYDTQGGKVNKKNRKLGAMSFALAEIYDADSITEGASAGALLCLLHAWSLEQPNPPLSLAQCRATHDVRRCASGRTS